ncbi:hypothetical protein AAHK20_32165 [Trinickia sp. YCB016]
MSRVNRWIAIFNEKNIAHCAMRQPLLLSGLTQQGNAVFPTLSGEDGKFKSPPQIHIRIAWFNSAKPAVFPVLL